MGNGETIKSLSAKDLITYFSGRMCNASYLENGITTGKEPCYPMIVFMLGSEAIKGYEQLSQNLFQIWPQYQDGILFLGLEKEGDDFIYIRRDNTSVVRETLPEENVSRLVEGLFSGETPFASTERLLVYYLIDTAAFFEEQEYDEICSLRYKAETAIGVVKTRILDMQIILLKENQGGNLIGNYVRNKLSEYDFSDREHSVKGILVLSNISEDNKMLPSWNVAYRIASSVIVLSNNSDSRVTADLFSGMIFTAGYARVEKPTADIANVIVKNFVERFTNKSTGQKADYVLQDKSFNEKIGLDENGMLRILSDYIAEISGNMIPTPDQFNYFPRRSDDHIDLSVLTVKEFNEETMGAWGCYFGNLLGKMAPSKETIESWKEEYKRLLRSGFTLEERIALAEQISEVEKRIKNVKEVSEQTGITKAAEDSMRYSIVNNDRFMAVFLESIREEGESATQFIASWKQFLQSRLQIFSVRDENLEIFYKKILQNYLDSHEEKVFEDFEEVQNLSQLKEFFEDKLKEIYLGNEVLSDSFEVELGERLKDQDEEIDVQHYISDKLTGDDFHRYLSVQFSLGEPVLSAILLKQEGSALYASLKEANENTYFYDTGDGNLAESTVIYRVTSDNLI